MTWHSTYRKTKLAKNTKNYPIRSNARLLFKTEVIQYNDVV